MIRIEPVANNMQGKTWCFSCGDEAEFRLSVNEGAEGLTYFSFLLCITCVEMLFNEMQILLGEPKKEELKNEGSQKRGVFGRPRKPRSSMDLKNARLQKGLTQRGVARALKITRGTYANVERGLKPIPEQWLPRLKGILELEDSVINAKNDLF